MLISKRFTFEASHVLPKHPGKCSRLHGHSWNLTVTVEGPIEQSSGFVMDYADLKRIVQEKIILCVDHEHLGSFDLKPIDDTDEVIGVYYGAFGSAFYPSSENLLTKFAEILLPHLPQLHSLTLDETCTSSATWRRTDG